jgi:hypothetical protein
MTNKASEIQENASALILQTVIPVLEKALQDQHEFVDTILQVLEKFVSQYEQARAKNDPHLFFKAWLQFTLDIDDAIAHRYEKPETRRVDEIFEEYASSKKSFIGNLPLEYEDIQSEQRFTSLLDDTWRVRQVKAWKRSWRGVSGIPLNIRNAFRKLFRKEKLVPKPWKYRVPLRNLTAYHYIEAFSLGLLPVLEKIYRELAISSQQLWQTSDAVYATVDRHLHALNYQDAAWVKSLPELDAEAFQQTGREIRDELAELQQEVKEDINHLLEEVYGKFVFAYDRAGTVELSASGFSNRRLKKEREKTDKSYVSFVRGWRNTLFALHDDWRIDEEFSTLSNRLLYLHYQLREEADHKVKQAVVPQINTSQQLIQNAVEAISEANAGNMEKVLFLQKEYVDQQLIRTLIPSTIAILYRQALPALLDNIQQQAAEQVSELPERRGLVKTNEYKRVIKTSEIDYVSPRQIVSFETLPNLRKSVNESKVLVTKELSHIQKLINEVGQISYFNLDSALSVYEGKQENKDKAQQIALEGLQRAVKGINGIRTDLEEIYRHLDEDVLLAVRHFNDELRELKSNDYALEIKLRVAKARAMERTRAIKQQSMDYLRNAVPYTARFIRENYGKAEQQLISYRRQMGIYAAAEDVSTEISDFLAETEKAIHQLPYVYQRLFSIRPLEEAVFYEERSTEIRMMQDALQNWSKGRYASTVVVGEKGSGITTLINFFLKQSNQKTINRCHIIRAQRLYQIHREEDFFTYMKEFFPDQTFVSMEDLTVYLQEHKQRVIFIFENLEHFFLRKVGGFKCLRLLFELISKTNQQVFWLCSCTLYTWRYLDKSIRISDYFEYIVELQPIENHQLREVILKRHRVSGYQVVYEPSESDRARKKFQKMSEQEKQAYLENEYFKDLNNITSGNFSIAQLFWMRSTRNVTEDTIHISSLKDYDFSFVKSIPLHHVLTLHSLLLHDGLREAQYQELAEYHELGGRASNKIGKSSLNLIQLMDDGLITRKDEVYLVNPLLYRQVVALLQTKNFLH